MAKYSSRYDVLVKTLIVGNSGVGKTALLKRFSENEFVENHMTTVGVDFVVKSLTVNNIVANLQIWDTAGQERFHTITTAYIRGAEALLLVFDVTDIDSFNQCERWLQEIRQLASEHVQVLLVANKIDLENRVVSKEQATKLATSMGIPLLETSAKTSVNVEAAFANVAQRCIAAKRGEEPRSQVSQQGISLKQGVKPSSSSCGSCVIL